MVVLTFTFSLTSVQAGAENYGSATVFEVTSVYDADTFRATIAGWPALIGERIPIRVKGIDAPELRGRCKEEIRAARQAKTEVVSMIRRAKHIELRNMQRDKYFRIVADVHLDGESLGESLISRGFARAYDGKAKDGWCP